MKKLLITLLLLVGLLFGGGYFLAFTQGGNDILKPFINSYLKQKLKGIDIKVDSFTLKPNHIVANATINGMAKANVDGDFDLFKKSFDAIYTLKANKIETQNIKIDEKIYIKGKAVGDIKKALIFGVGKVARSDIEYKLDLIDQKPQNITAKIDRANLAKLLSLAGQKPYASGVVNLVANIPSLDEKNLKGSAKLSIISGKINSKLIKNDFKLNLPKNTTFNLNATALLNQNSIKVDAKALTSLANLFIKNLHYNLKSNSLKTPYTLDIKDLSKLNSLANMKLKGDFKANGKVSLKNKKFIATANTNSLGGKLSLIYHNDKALINLKNISSKAIFYRLTLPKYTDARVSGEVDIKSIKKLSGKFKLVADGVNSKRDLKRMYDFDIDRDIKYHLTSNGTLQNQKVFAIADIKNSFGDIKLKDIVYNLKAGSLNSKYELYIDKLSKLNYITKQKLVGDLKVVGEIKKAKDFIITGHTNKFNGSEEFKLVNNLLSATVKGAKLTGIQKTLSYPLMLEADADATLKYDLKSSSGSLNVVMQKAKMLPNKLTKIIKALGGTDLSAQHYNDTRLDAKLSKNLIDFNFIAKSKAVILKIANGKVFQPSGKLDATLEAKAGKNNLRFKIQGTTSNPKIKLDSSSIKDNLKAKAKERLKEKLNEKKEELKKRLEDKLKEKLNDKLKDELKNGLFKKLF